MNNIVSRKLLSIRFNRETKALLLITAFILGSLLTITVAGGFSAKSRRHVVHPSQLSQDTPPEATGTPASSPIKGVLFTIRSGGIEPAEVELTEGRYVIAVDNRSGIDEVRLAINRGGAGRLKEAKLTRKQPGWRNVFDLKPGRYTVIKINSPESFAQITVKPK
jgi:hypothetical protein